MEYEIKDIEKFKDILKAFRHWVKCGHSNIITPHLISVRNWKDYIVEFSSGYGMDQKELYGVTVFQYKEEEEGFYGTDIPEEIKSLSECFNDKKEALKRRDLILKTLKRLV